jgi:hypothetical protein
MTRVIITKTVGSKRKTPEFQKKKNQVSWQKKRMDKKKEETEKNEPVSWTALPSLFICVNCERRKGGRKKKDNSAQ